VTDALAIRRKNFSNEHWDVACSLMNLARVHYKKGALAEAVTAMREALRLNRKFYGEDHFEVFKSNLMLAQMLAKQGNKESLLEAEQLFRAVVLPNCERLFGRGQTRHLAEELASILRQQGKDAEAEALFKEQKADDETK
jgi:tetratricopeptide (TPR) repeat protein